MASVPFKVKALFEYTSSHEDDLPFSVGQIMTVVDVDDDDWYGGEYVDGAGVKQEGIFPRNFVEKYEPVAPPRPTRSRKKESEPEVVSPTPATPASPPPVAQPEPEPEPQPEPEPEPEQEPEPEPRILSPPPPPTATVAPISPPAVPVAEPEEPRTIPAPAPAPVPEPVAAPIPVPIRAEPAESSNTPVSAPAQPPAKNLPTGKAPPPVTSKPSSNAFKDRIAAFNKPAAAPVAPFKPGGLGSSGFIKKPYVPPPPSRNAYVPPPRDAPVTKVYRREEDPEIKQREAEAMDNAEKAGLVPTSSAPEGEEGEQQKPQSLKERIALLQKQQQEQAMRQADVASKKEKPKRPPKKRTDSEAGPSAEPDEAETSAPLERQDTNVSAGKSPEDPQSPKPPLPIRRKSTKGPEVNDGNEADMSGAGDTTEGQEELTERDDSDAQAPTQPMLPPRMAPAPVASPPPQQQEEEEGEDEEDDMDPEERRKAELRARMAKMSGGMGMMGMHNMFGAPPLPKKKKPAPVPERRPSEISTEEPTSPRTAPPVPTPMALPGMGKQQQEEPLAEEPVAEESTPVASTSPKASEPPAVPGGRPAPPPIPVGARPPPPPPPVAKTPSIGSQSDDEQSELPQATPLAEAPSGRAPPPIPGAPPALPTSPRASISNDPVSGDAVAPGSPAMPPPPINRRSSRPPPPIPGGAPPTPIQARPPPPPPPGAPAPQAGTGAQPMAPMKPGSLDNGEEGEVSEYEGDYDTDIGSSVPHKDALKAHSREKSTDEGSDAPPMVPPPVPTAIAPAGGPPPVPSRQSVDIPRAAPPPPPPVAGTPAAQQDDDYDPYNYSAPQSAATPLSFSVTRNEEPSFFPESSPAIPSSPPPAPSAARAPPPAPPGPSRSNTKQSLDIPRSSFNGRRSVDANRPSIETGFMAHDVDLAQHTNWWLTPNGVPPVFHGRKDIYYESDESTASAAGGKTAVTKNLYVLFQDYSQTVISITFDPQDPSNTQMEQRHEAPPRHLRQDQLEQSYEMYGAQIATAAASKKDSVVADGTPHAFVLELLKPFKDALGPVGTRSFGALVYANLANASTQMNDEIRPGDIISIRNAKFQGKHGAMHAKYSMEVGKPDHVGVVSEWDGTKKKVRAWEQGRENKKVKQESFRLDDLRSGEVKIWRVMPRSWVGWMSQD